MKYELIQNHPEHPEHIEQVATWLYNQWGHLSHGASVERAMRSLKTNPGDDGMPLSYVAIENNVVHGVARLVENDMGIRPNLKPWLASVYVPAEHRHKKIGRSLCQFILDACRQLSYKTIYLYTPDKSYFYAKQGWGILETVEYRNENVTIMHYEVS